MVRLISRQREGLAALELTKLFGIDDFPAAKDSGRVLIIIIYCYVIIIYWLSKSARKDSYSFTFARKCVGRTMGRLTVYGDGLIPKSDLK